MADKRSDIELLGDPRTAPGQARVSCPWCRKMMVADLSTYTIDMSTPIRSRCPYCSGEIYTALIILSHKNIPQLGKLLSHVIEAVETQADPLKPDASGIVLEGDKH